MEGIWAVRQSKGATPVSSDSNGNAKDRLQVVVAYGGQTLLPLMIEFRLQFFYSSWCQFDVLHNYVRFGVCHVLIMLDLKKNNSSWCYDDVLHNYVRFGVLFCMYLLC